MAAAEDGIVIVGASAAGLSAADGLREGGYTGTVTVLDDEVLPGYDRPMLSKGLLAAKADSEPVALRSAQQLVDKGIDLLAGHAAVGLDIDRRLVVTSWGEALPWDQVLLATGVVPRRLVTTGGTPLPTLRTRDDLGVARQLAAGGRAVTLIGAGFIGLVVAAALRCRGIDVCVVGDGELPLAAQVGDQVAGWLHQLHLAHGATFELGVPTSGVTETAVGYDIQLADGRVRQAGAVLAGIGTDPRSDWLVGSGVELDQGVAVDPAGRTNVAGVWAAGDLASTLDTRLGRRRRFEHWTHAIEHGRHVGLNMARRTDVPFEGVPYVWTEQYGHTVHLLGERQPGDTDVLIEGDLAAGDFVVAHLGGGTGGGDLHGATICGRTRALRTFKKLLRSGASREDVLGAAAPA